MPRVVTQPRPAGDRTRDLLIASPTPYHCATTPHRRSRDQNKNKEHARDRRESRQVPKSLCCFKWFPLCSSRQCTTIDPRSDNKHQLSTSGLSVRMPHPKVLGFRALYFAVAYGICFIFSFIMLSRCPKKIILPDSGGCSPFPPAHTPMAGVLLNSVTLSLYRRSYTIGTK